MTGRVCSDPDTLTAAELAILAKRFDAICRKMMNTLLRTGRSGVLNTARDFSCCIVTADNQLLATAESLPIHVLAGPDLMSASIQAFHDDLAAGDAFLHNSPYHGCSHAADHTILVPVFDSDGTHHFTVVAKAHQADCGNALPTTYTGGARDVYEEGALIFPGVRVQRRYRDIDDIIRMCRMRIRVPKQWWGDYLAELGAARIGERALEAMGREVGWGRLRAFAEQWFDYSEARMVAALGALPRGRCTTSSTHDPFPGVPDGIPVNVTVEIDPDAARVEVDLCDNVDCQPCGLNLSEACSRTAAMVGVFNSIDHTVPPNAGSFRRIRVLLRENCVVGIPRHPFSCSLATTNLADHVGCGVQRAIATLADGHGMADTGSTLPASDGVISGFDPRTGDAFINQLFLGHGGGAATADQDGWLTIQHVGNAGMCHLDSVEVDELMHPIVVRNRAFIVDSGGAGRRRGAPGMYVEFGPHDCNIEVGIVSNGTHNAPKGVRGGREGATASQWQRHANGAMEPLDGCAQVRLGRGEGIASYSSGGGGYGAPTEREPERVAHDVREGWITAAAARAIYGVVIDDDGFPNQSQTRSLRAALVTPPQTATKSDD